MKKGLLAIMSLLFAFSIYASDIKELVVTTNPPMHCQNCENKIKKGDVRFVKGVKKIETSIPDQRVTIEYDADKTNPEQIEQAFQKMGYKIEIIDPENASAKQECQNAKQEGTCTGDGNCHNN